MFYKSRLLKLLVVKTTTYFSFAPQPVNMAPHKDIHFGIRLQQGSQNYINGIV